MGSLKLVEGADRSLRQRLDLKGELALTLTPTVLLVFGLAEFLSQQRLLFASLAASAFVIYLDPQHGTNTVRTLMIAHMLAATLGLITYLTSPATHRAGARWWRRLLLMIVFDPVHPPAVSTSLGFAFRAGDESNLVPFGLAIVVTALLVLLQRTALWLLSRLHARSKPFLAFALRVAETV